MQLNLLRQAFEKYKKFLSSSDSGKRLYVWESQRIFQEFWDLETTELVAMFDQSFQNSTTRRLWRREAYEPKEMMLKFIEMAPDFFLQMFGDLFNEDKTIDGRIDRFIFYCDQLLQEYKSQKPHSIENSHFHDDGYQMISLYLSFRFPDQYAYYRYQVFRLFLEKMGVVNLPEVNDFERFVKVSRTVFKLMKKEEDLMTLHQNRLEEGKHYFEDSLLLIYDFMVFTTEM